VCLNSCYGQQVGKHLENTLKCRVVPHEQRTMASSARASAIAGDRPPSLTTLKKLSSPWAP
jgi:hypothetical protein